MELVYQADAVLVFVQFVLVKKSKGQLITISEPVLTEKEQRQGWIFPCQAYAKSHLVLSLDE